MGDMRHSCKSLLPPLLTLKCNPQFSLVFTPVGTQEAATKLCVFYFVYAAVSTSIQELILFVKYQLETQFTSSFVAVTHSQIFSVRVPRGPSETRLPGFDNIVWPSLYISK